VVECNPDVALVETLTSPSRRRNKHAGSKSMVLRRLMRTYENALGIIDEDPDSTQPDDLQRFREIDNLERYQLRILQHNPRNNRLVVIIPRLEEWIIRASSEANINPQDYNLPNNPNQLHEIINIRENRFRELIRDLMQRSDRVKALQTCLRESAET